MRLAILLATLAACKAPPAPPGPIEEVTVGGMRAVMQRVGGAKPGDELPLLLALHPMGGDIDWPLQIFTPLHRPALVVAPCGSASGGACEWYDLNDPDGVRDAEERVLRATAELRRRMKIRGKPLVMGFSQGAVVAFGLARDYPSEIAAAFPVAGLAPKRGANRARPGELPPVFAFLGASDPVFKLADVQGSIDALKGDGYAASLRTYANLGHDVTDEELRDLRASVESQLP